LGFASSAFIKCTEDAVYLAGPNRPMLVAASSKDGKLLWKKDCSVEGKYPTEGGNVGLIIRPDGVYALGQGHVNAAMSSFKLEPLTGKVLATFPSRDRCTRATGCFDTIFTRGGKGGSTAAFDVTSQEPRMGTISPMRPACQDGVLTAHGYLFWGPWQCRCDMTQLGVISLGPGGRFDYTGKATNDDRLETYFYEQMPEYARLHEWNAYRYNNSRSVRVPFEAPAAVKQVWTWTPKAATIPTAPIIVDKQVILGGQDGIVRSIQLGNGELGWSAYTSGPMKYPPAYWRERLYVGSGDGYIYCLQASTGKPMWRFRTAPKERMIPIYGSISSTWPVGSGVLVEAGIVCGASGISNFDGTHVFGLNALDGKIKWQQHSSSHGDDDLPNGGVSVQGPFLLHNNAVHMASGNTPPIASYGLYDGKFTPSTNGRGKDLFIRHGKVEGTGFPLYWRPEDDQFISTMELEIFPGKGEQGVRVLQVGMPPADPNAPARLALVANYQRGEKPKEIWSNPVYQEIAAVAIAKNALIVTGLNRDKKDPNKIEAGICAVNLADGKVLWRESLPGVPTAWGLAIASEGNDLIATLMDGRVICYRNGK
jgi:outer membrane protein assembly factor BamB